MDFEKIGGHNAAVRGYILRMLVKGYHNALAVRRISNSLVRDGLVSDPDIWEPLKCQRQFEIVRKRRRNFVVFRRQGGGQNQAFPCSKRVFTICCF